MSKEVKMIEPEESPNRVYNGLSSGLSESQIAHQIEMDDDEDSLWDDDEKMDETCPNCHRQYDAIDYEYQICHICKFNNSGS